MTDPATLFISIQCRSVSDAQTMLRNFVRAGLNTDSPAVHVAIGDPTPTPDPDLEARALAAVENTTQRSTT